MMDNKKGLAGAVMIGIGVVLLVIAVGAVAYPVAKTVFNLTPAGTYMNGTDTPAIDKTVVSYLPTFIMLTVLVGIVTIAILGILKR